MPFKEIKCKVLAFGDQKYRPVYMVEKVDMNLINTARYMSVIRQSNLKLDQCIKLKIDKISKTLGAIKHILHEAPEKVEY